MNIFSLSLVSLLAIAPLHAQAPAAEPAPTPEPAPQPTAETDPALIKQNSSYGFGYNNGNAFKQQMSRFGLGPNDIDREVFAQGFMDAFDGKEAANGQEALNAAMLGLRNQVQAREKVLAEENLRAAEEFLAKNKQREGVTTTDSGLQYEVLKAGEGEKYDGSEGSTFLVNYRGTLLEGTQFDASPEGSPVTMTLNVVPGFREALSTMPVGSKWKIFLKPDLAYGETRRNELIGPNTALIFEVELTEIKAAPPRPKAVSPPIQIPPAPDKSE